MVTRVMRSAVWIALTGLILTGCGRQVSRAPSEAEEPDLLATGPVSDVAPAPRSFVVPSIEATGGLPAWSLCRRLQFDAVVTAHHPDGGLYLTEHRFTLYPWSDAIQVIAGEPRAPLAWQVVRGQYAIHGDEGLDISPLSSLYREYAEAVLQIVTAPVRMLGENVALTRRPIPMQIGGQWYQPIDARYQAREIVSRERGRDRVTTVEPHWTHGTYFQNQRRPFVDLIWLGNPVEQRFLLVRGYDYARPAGEGVLIPTKIEIFQSGPEAQWGPRLALIDLKR